MPNFDFNTFLQYKDQLLWEQVKTWTRSGTKRHLIWKGYKTVTEGNRTYVARRIPMFYIYVTVDDTSRIAAVSLYVNWKFDIQGKDQQKIDGPHPIGRKADISDEFIREYLGDRYGVKDVDFKETPVGEQVFKTTKSVILRSTMINYSTKQLANIFLRKITIPGGAIYKVDTVISNAQEGIDSEDASKRQKGAHRTVQEATADFYRTIRQIKSIGFQEAKDAPENANQSNWNFELGMPSDVAEIYQKNLQETLDQIDTSQFEADPLDLNLRESQDQTSKKSIRIAQNKGYESWYSGTIPPPSTLAPYRGTSSVDASQLKSIFGGTDDAIKLVNNFDSKLLQPIAFIFNFSSGGAFGVFVSALDDKIKADKVKDDMEKEGYTIEDLPNGSFSASHPDKTQSEIKVDMDRRYNSETLKGGATFGIDMNKTLADARRDASSIPNVDEEDFKNIATIKVAQTMVHEATHAAGAMTEGPAEGSASQFLSWVVKNVLPQMNATRQKRLESRGMPYDPSKDSLIISEHGNQIGKSSGWYGRSQSLIKQAQFGAQFSTPKNLSHEEMMVAPWTMFMNYEIGATETMLNRTRHSDSVAALPEKKMREQEATKWGNNVDTLESIENLLIKDRQPFQGYKAIETLMEDRRVKPLMVPITKGSSSNSSIKTAGIDKAEMGFLNNLDLPMGERVYTSTSLDDDTWFDWKKIRKQQRYNPEYGPEYSKTNGIYGWWRDPKLEPELWSQMLNNRPFMSSPAARFANTTSRTKDPAILAMILTAAHSGIESGKIKGTRFICSDDILCRIQEFFDGHPSIRIITFKDCGTKRNNAVWAVYKDVDDDTVKLAEKYFSDDESDESKEAFEQICGVTQSKKSAIKKILSQTKKACKEFGVEDMYVVGGFPRAIAMKEPIGEVSDLDFSASWPDQCLKIGGLLAEDMGASSQEIFHRTMTLSWRWGGVKCDFRGNFTPVDVRNMLREQGLKTTPLNMDIYSRDFTMNMLVYSLKDGKVYDITGASMDDIRSKTIRTFFDPDLVVEQNPIIIPRAIKYAVRYGFTIDPKLGEAMKKHSDLLFDGRYSEERLAIALEETIKEGKEEAVALLKEYGLERLKP